MEISKLTVLIVLSIFVCQVQGDDYAEGLVTASVEETATVAEMTTLEKTFTVAEMTAVEETFTVAEMTTVEEKFTVEEKTTVEEITGDISVAEGTLACESSEFSCDYGECIAHFHVCDGYPDCFGGEDEFRCSVTEYIFVNSSYIFNSPNYPLNYPNNVEYIWYFSTDPGFQLLVTFSAISTERDFDYIYVSEGSYTSALSYFLLRWSGIESPDELRILSSENFIWVTFESDEIITYNGFVATVEVTNMNREELNCGKEFDCKNGVCLPQIRVCDGMRECGNNADERNENCTAEGLVTASVEETAAVAEITTVEETFTFEEMTAVEEITTDNSVAEAEGLVTASVEEMATVAEMTTVEETFTFEEMITDEETATFEDNSVDEVCETWTKWASSCYLFVSTRALSWDAAAAQCLTYHDKAHLVFIESASENDFVVHLVGPQTYPWLGLRYIEGMWVWSSQGTTVDATLTYTNWGKDNYQEPDGDCGYFTTWNKGNWEFSRCDQANVFICELEE